MREIKFRGKRIANDEWVYGFFTIIDDKPAIITDSIEWIDGSELRSSRWDYIDKNTAGQFIGLFDVDLKEIYEGDIVEWTFFKYGETEYEYHLVGVIAWAQGGMIFRVIENDFHDRKDLSPNVCALYVEKAFRNCGIAGRLLEFACRDMAARGFGTLYLVTDHTSFYERYGWKFLCMVRDEGGNVPIRMYVHGQ